MRSSPLSLLCSLLLGALLGACGPADTGLQLGEERLSPNEAEKTAAMIEAIKAVSLQRYPTGVVERFNQSKTLGCFDARFSVSAELPRELQEGIFIAGASYPAQLRFANATQEDDRDKDFRGLSIKLHGVPGAPLWGNAGEQDFLLNSYPALFAGTPEEFLDFVEASRDGALWKYFINPVNLDSLWILFRGRKNISSPLAIRYWSTTPYRFGRSASAAVKYSVQPCGTLPDTSADNGDADYLSRAVRRQLAQAPACFDFMVQFQTDPHEMPIEDASVIWDESAAPFQTLARISIDRQEPEVGQSANQCEQLSFNPWQSLAEHRPLGALNRIRRQIYADMADFRNSRNISRLDQ
jgi:catalase